MSNHHLTITFIYRSFAFVEISWLLHDIINYKNLFWQGIFIFQFEISACGRVRKYAESEKSRARN